MKIRYNVFGSISGLFGVLLTGSFLMGSLSAQAQPKVVLRLSFDTEQNRYQVYAQPNFSAKNFTWGPSQVSVVVPLEVANEPLSVRSTNVGSWSDNSTVFAPASASGADFHGMTSPGGKLDLVAGEEFLLFDFNLKTGYIANVRLFDTALDPGSDRTGMRGGDFRSYMSDERGGNYLYVNVQSATLAVRETSGTVEAEVATQVVAYPNPSLNGKFRLYLKGFHAEEVVTVRLVNLNGITVGSFDEKVETLAGRVIDVGSSVDGYVLLSLERPANHQIFTHKLWFR